MLDLVGRRIYERSYLHFPDPLRGCIQSRSLGFSQGMPCLAVIECQLNIPAREMNVTSLELCNHSHNSRILRFCNTKQITNEESRLRTHI